MKLSFQITEVQAATKGQHLFLPLSFSTTSLVPGLGAVSPKQSQNQTLISTRSSSVLLDPAGMSAVLSCCSESLRAPLLAVLGQRWIPRLAPKAAGSGGACSWGEGCGAAHLTKVSCPSALLWGSVLTAESPGLEQGQHLGRQEAAGQAVPIWKGSTWSSAAVALLCDSRNSYCSPLLSQTVWHVPL